MRQHQFSTPITQGRIVISWDLLGWANHIELFNTCTFIVKPVIIEIPIYDLICIWTDTSNSLQNNTTTKQSSSIYIYLKNFQYDLRFLEGTTNAPKETSDDVRAVFFIALAYLDNFVQSGFCEHLVNMGTTRLMNRLYLLFLAPQLIQVCVEILAARSSNICILNIHARYSAPLFLFIDLLEVLEW